MVHPIRPSQSKYKNIENTSARAIRRSRSTPTGPITEPIGKLNRQCRRELQWVDCDEELLIRLGNGTYAMVSKEVAARESEYFKKCLSGEKNPMPATFETVKHLNFNPKSTKYFKFIIEWLTISDNILTVAQLADKNFVLHPSPAPWEREQAAKWTFQELTWMHFVAEDFVIPRLTAIIRTLFIIKSNISRTFPSPNDIILIYDRYGGYDSELKKHVVGMYGEAITKLRDPYGAGGIDRCLSLGEGFVDRFLVSHVEGVDKYVDEYVNRPIEFKGI